MKVNINKYQNGGGFATFLPIIKGGNTPTQKTSKRSTTSKKEEEEEAGIVDDKLYAELIKEGLRNDVDMFIDKLIEIESSDLAYTDPQNRLRMQRLLEKDINNILQQKSYWTDSINKAKEAGGLNEVAVGSSGEVFVKDKKGKVEAISTSEYKRKHEGTPVMTVAELLNARQFNPDLAFNSEVFSVAQSAVGLKTITDHAQKLMETLSDYSESSDLVYDKKDLRQQLEYLEAQPASESVINAMKDLEEVLNTPGDYAEVKTSYTSKRKNIDRALNYIWTSIGQGAQRKLNAVGAVNNLENPKEILYNMLYSYTEEDTDKTISPVSETSATGSSQVKSLSAFQILNKGVLNNSLNTFALNEPELGIVLRGSIGTEGVLVGQDDNAIGQTTLGNIFSKHGYSRVLDTSKAFFGDKEIKLQNQNQIIHDGSTTARTFLPVNPDGTLDYGSFEVFKKLYAEYEAKKDTASKEELERIFNEEGFNVTIDEDGNEKFLRESKLVKPFLAMYGWTNSASGLTDDNSGAKQLSKNEQNQLEPIFNDIWTIRTNEGVQDFTPDKSWHNEKYYKGLILVPYRDNATAIVDAISKQGATTPVPTLQTVQHNYKEMNKPTINGNAKALENN
jgi:hypothetical protein